MAVGRAQILELAKNRKALHEVLSREDAPLADGGTAPRQLRLDCNPDPAIIDPSYVYSEFGPERIPNSPPVGGRYDPQVIVEPPIWSFESPALLTFRKAAGWKLVDERAIHHLVDCVRVKCPAMIDRNGELTLKTGKGHKAAKHVASYAVRGKKKKRKPYPWMPYGDQLVGGRVATSGSLMVGRLGLSPPEVQSLPFVGRSSNPDDWLDELLAWRGTGSAYMCPQHKVPCVDYPVIHGYAYAFSLFSNTSKMSTLSWSLPAGPPEFGGTCPGAKGMAAMAGAPFFDMGTLRPEKRKEDKAYGGAERLIRRTIGADISETQLVRAPIVIRGKKAQVVTDVSTLGITPWSEPIPGRPGEFKILKDVASVAELRRAGTPFELNVKDLRSDFVCDSCYALKGNYAYTTQQIAGIMRQYWLDWMLGKRWQPGAPEWETYDPESGVDPRKGDPPPEVLQTAAREMVCAIEAAMDNVKLRRSEGHSLTHFRVHDSADFSAAYMIDLWGMVCQALPHILFWFPTRIWQFPNYRERLQYWVGNPDALADPGVQAWLTERGLPVGQVRPEGPLHNMAIRASAFRFNDAAPELPDLIVAGSGSGAAGNNATWNCPAYLARDATCANAINPWGEAYLQETTGLSMIEMMQRRSWTVEERNAFESSAEIPSSWLTEPPAIVTKKVRDPVLRITYEKTGPQVRKPGGSVPEYERILRRAVSDGSFQAWLETQPSWDGSPVTPTECRLCWGGFNFEGRGSALEPSPLGPLGMVTVTYHEH